MMQGTLLRGMGGLYTVRGEDGTEYVLRAKKKFRRQRISPLVGDDILFTPGGISDELTNLYRISDLYYRDCGSADVLIHRKQDFLWRRDSYRG